MPNLSSYDPSRCSTIPISPLYYYPNQTKCKYKKAVLQLKTGQAPLNYRQNKNHWLIAV
jgi:hypothetical protein